MFAYYVRDVLRPEVERPLTMTLHNFDDEPIYGKSFQAGTRNVTLCTYAHTHTRAYLDEARQCIKVSVNRICAYGGKVVAQ